MPNLLQLCEPFREEIEGIKNSFSRSAHALELETTQVVEKDTWEYTAREFLHRYRFDTVFAADRFKRWATPTATASPIASPTTATPAAAADGKLPVSPPVAQPEAIIYDLTFVLLVIGEAIHRN